MWSELYSQTSHRFDPCIASCHWRRGPAAAVAAAESAAAFAFAAISHSSDQILFLPADLVFVVASDRSIAHCSRVYSRCWLAYWDTEKAKVIITYAKKEGSSGQYQAELI